MTYNIRVTRPSPSLSQDHTVFQAATYAEAVKIAQDAWKVARRPVVLCDGECGVYFWHRIDSAGLAIDRNTNSGIPAQEQLV